MINSTQTTEMKIVKKLKWFLFSIAKSQKRKSANYVLRGNRDRVCVYIYRN